MYSIRLLFVFIHNVRKDETLQILEEHLNTTILYTEERSKVNNLPILNKPHSTGLRYKSYPVSRGPSLAFAPLSLRYCSDTGPLLLRSASTRQILQFYQNNAEWISISKKNNPSDYNLTPDNQEQE